ncbi:MAG: TraB/GumN family protein [Clostridiales bacterium]|nr:TraB/GumN family protein [Clostridiales bacterium]
MKKRLLSLFLILSMLLTVMPVSNVFAQEVATDQPAYSAWATSDLIVGDTYGIYPQSWYDKGMQKPITHGQLRGLLAGLRLKLLNTDCVVDYNEQSYKLKNDMTVEEVLEFLYLLISDYEFSGDIGITDNGTALEYMAAYGIFTGNEDGLSLNDRCTVEQACVIATRLITHIYDALDAASKGFLWKIESGENIVYLLGSVHLADYDIYPFSNKILKAFEESDVLGVELDMLTSANVVNTLLLQYGVYMDGTTLKDHVSEEAYTKTVETASIFGYSEELISMFKPWAIYLMFSALTNSSTGSVEEMATAATLGIDMKFTVDAYMTGKPIIELEGYEFQIRVLDSFSDELAEYLMVSTMDAIADIMEGKKSGDNQFLDITLDYWRDGDIEGFMKDIAPLLVAEETPDMSEEDKAVLPLLEEYTYKLITERDKGMAEKIDGFLKAEGSSTYFVVVGTGHYISEYSVINILEEMGYEINLIR